MTKPVSQLGAWIGRFAQPHWIRFVCASILGVHLLLLALMFLTERQGRSALGPGLGADYPAFHLAGYILNHYPPARLYDAGLQDRLYHELMPARPREEVLPFAQGPILAFLLRPFAALPYAWSYAGWLVFTGGLAACALVLSLRAASAIPAADRTTALLLALAFPPLLTECWLGGQTSAFGLVWVAVAVWCERRGSSMAEGAALAMCLYKPTLLLLVLPMLVVTGRFRVLAGFTAAAVALAAFCLVAIRPEGCQAYVRMLLGYAQNVAGSTTAFRTFKFVDVRSFYTLLQGAPGPAVRWASLATAAAVLPFVVAAWWQTGRQAGDRRLRVLCGTISLTMVFNLYTPVYDVSLILPGVILTADVVYRQSESSRATLTPGFRTVLALLAVVPWFSQILARTVGFQPLTLVLLALGAYQLELARRIPAPPAH